MIRTACVLFVVSCHADIHSLWAEDCGGGQMLHVSFDSPKGGNEDLHIFSADFALGAAQSMSETRRGDVRYRTVSALPKTEQDDEVLGFDEDGVPLPLEALANFGKFNGAARGSVIFEAEGNVHLPQGTISIWFRMRGEGSRTLIAVGSLDEGYYLRAVWVTISKTSVSLEFYDHYERSGCKLQASGLSLAPLKWHHFAMVWDQMAGAKIFLSGKAAATNLGKASWHAPATPIALGLGGGHATEFMYNSPVSGGALTDLDELRVFDHPLSDAEIKTLFERNEPPKSSPTPTWYESRLAHRRFELDWNETRPLPVLNAGGGTLRRVAPLSCRSARKPRYAPFDGRRGHRRKGAWPFWYQDYAAQLTEGLSVEFPESATANVVSLIGDFKGKLNFREEIKGGATTLDFDGSKGELTTAALKEPVPLRFLNILRTEGHIKDVGLYLWTPGRSPGSAPRRSFLTIPKDVEVPTVFHTAYGPGDRSLLIAAEAAPKGGTLEVLPMRYIHLMTPRLKEAFPLKAIRIHLKLARPVPPGRLFISLRDPFNPRGEKVYTSFQFEGGRTLDLTLDLGGAMVPAGNQVWVSLLFEKGAQIAVGSARPSSFDLLTGEREEIIAAHIQEQVLSMQELFHRQSEGHPFDSGNLRLETLRQYQRMAELCAVMQDLRQYAPDRRELVGTQEKVYHYSWQHQKDMPFKFRTMALDDLAGPEGAPRWAVLVREMSSLCRKWARWWVAERQDANGELEGGYNDDTDLVQGWANIIFMSDEDGRVREGLRRLAEAGWKLGVMVNGLGKTSKNILHAYEDGINMEQLMALTQYGNPVWIERMMETCRRYDDLTEIGKDGKRHFIARRVSDSQITRGKDDSGNAMMFQPALFLAWYNGNERMIRLLSEWADSWITEDGQWKGGNSFGIGTFMLGLYELTGEDRFLAPMRNKTYAMSIDGGYLSPDWFQHTPMGQEAAGNKAFVSYITNSWQNRLGIRFDGHLFYGMEMPFITWLLNRDNELLEKKLEAGITYMRRLKYALTEANPSTDRIPIPQMLLDRMMLGGVACRRNVHWPTHAVSWEGTDGEVAVFVTKHSRESLSMNLYNFEENEKDVGFRVWRLGHGQYEITEGPDANGDGKMDSVKRTRTMILARYSRVLLSVPQRQLWLVRLMQTKRLDSILRRADLAICADDAAFDLEKGRLTVQVHNIGAKPSGPFTVTLSGSDGKVVETRKIKNLDAPVDLMPRRTALIFNGLKLDSRVVLSVDSDGTLSEITSVNNAVKLNINSLSNGH